MAPPGIKFILRKPPKYRDSWYANALSGWYIGPSLEYDIFQKQLIPSTNLVCIGKPVSWFTHKIIITTATTTNIIIATAKYLTAVLKQTNKNPLLPPSDTITHKALLQLNSIFSNPPSELKLQQFRIFKPPKVSTSKPVSAPPRVSPSTAQDVHNISPTTQKHYRCL